MDDEEAKRRAAGRTRVLMTATLVSPTGSHKVLVRDISREGAQIYADASITAGHDACFERGPLFVAAHIAWCRSGIAGLKFYRELTAEEQDAAFHSVIPPEGDGGE